MITGRQIRASRKLLHWNPNRVAKASRLSLSIVTRAEPIDGEAVITFAHAMAIKRALQSAGVEFAPGSEPRLSLQEPGADAVASR